MPDQLIFQRRESKYLLTDRQARGLLASLSDHPTPDRYSHSAIRSIYYDTPDFRLIRRSMERPVYKEKLRLRSYGCPGPEDTVFAELKKKYRSVVYKRRVALPLAWAEAGLARRRALILETQSANANAIGFYLHEGFGLIGLDLCCYTNCDIQRKDVRLELGWFPQD